MKREMGKREVRKKREGKEGKREEGGVREVDR